MNLSDISALSILLPLVVGLITIYRQDKTLKKLSVFILVTAVGEVIASLYVYFGENNMFLFHTYSYIEIFAYSIIFMDLQKGWLRKTIPILAGIFVIFSIVNISLWESLKVFNSNQRFVGNILIIIITLLYFVKVFNEATVQKIERDHFFWFSSILLIYTTGTLFLFILGKQVHTKGNSVYWDLHSVLNILLNLGFALTLWLGTRKSN